MLEQDVTIINKLGLHARAATLLVQLCEEFDADIQISCNGLSADAKSIMDVLMLAATFNTVVTIRVEDDSSEEEEHVMEEVINLFNNRFNEAE